MVYHPERDLATSIATTLGLTVGSMVFWGRVLPPETGSGAVPAKAIFIIPIGGPKPENYLGQTKVRRYSDVQVRVRDNQEDFDGGWEFARSVRDAAHHAVITGYNEIEVLSSEPLPLGPDHQGLPEWSMTVRMTRVA